MGNVGREMEIPTKIQKVLEIKKTLIEVKDTFDGLISRLDIAEERISELEVISIETPKLKSKEKKD